MTDNIVTVGKTHEQIINELWRSPKNPPKDGTRIIATLRGNNHVSIGYGLTEGFCIYTDYGGSIFDWSDVLAWMPVPKPYEPPSF